MTMHGDHHTTDVEDAAFDATMKIGGVVIGLLVIAGMALWYILFNRLELQPPQASPSLESIEPFLTRSSS